MLVANGFCHVKGDPTVKAREVRVGLVLYGGVSLAVYINGVAHEFFRAVRGQGVYRLVKALTDSDVLVDVVSGTSAGGINGVLLSYALCHDRDFAGCAALWRAHGGIRDLLRSPRVDPEQCQSLLDSEGYFHTQLAAAFKALTAYRPERGSDGTVLDDASTVEELDLFVTGTNVRGNLSTEFDGMGHPINVKDHRSVFRLEYRRDRKTFAGDPGADVTHQALAKLSRLTSCFPAAFAPVCVGGDDPKRADAAADALLTSWGCLAEKSYFVDGGVLDNKPFTHTTRAIFGRTADREVKRILFFVEPDPEQEPPPLLAAPNIVQTVLGSLISMPGYESIAADLRLLADHNRAVQQYNRVVADLLAGPPAPPDEAALGGTGLAAGAASPAGQLYARSRLVALSQRVVEGLFRSRSGQAVLIPEGARATAARLVREFDRLLTAEGAGGLFEDFDVYYRLRRLYRVVALIHDLLYSRAAPGMPNVTADQARGYKELWHALNRQIKLLEMLRAAMERLIDDAPFDWKKLSPDDLWLAVQAALYGLLDPDTPAARRIAGEARRLLVEGTTGEWLPDDQLELAGEELKQLVVRLIGAVGRPATAVPAPRSVLVSLEQYERAFLLHYLGETPEDPIRRAYDGFAALDTCLYPLELSSGIREKSVIDIIRVSPCDAQTGFSDRDASRKVAGAALHHFGGFFKRSWRANDILWGRLDGLCQLVETLLDAGRLEHLVNQDSWRARLRDSFFGPDASDDDTPPFTEALDPARLFPRAGALTHAECARWLRDLLSSSPARRAAALTQLPALRQLLIEAAQLEVIAVEVPHVIEDAIAEQMEWNRFRVAGAAPKNDGAKPESPAAVVASPFEVPGALLDAQLLAVAAERVGRELQHDPPGSAPPAPKATRLGAFFTGPYRVGEERWDRDIPSAVLLEVLATALLVLRSCVLSLFGPEQRRAIRRNLLYKFGLDYPLRAFHGAAVLTRAAPHWALVLFIAAALLSALALAVGINWRDEIIFPHDQLHPDGQLQLKWLMAFIVVPAGILLGEGLFLLAYEGDWGWKGAGVFILVAVVALAIRFAGDELWETLGGPTGRVQTLLLTVVPRIVLMAQAVYLGWLLVRKVRRRAL